ncbi:ABC-2 family transporter protein [Dactylosporangium sp. NPDC050688]|uniref:ABC transporter permease n=1 Tax=Dactylosporangium sp. NPDC050688 TaxID=3157217 RepID=UPI0033D3B551
MTAQAAPVQDWPDRRDFSQPRPRGALWRAYLAMGRAHLRTVIAYRTSFLFGLLASTFGSFAMLYLWRAVLSHGHRANGFDWPHLRTYLLVTYFAGSLVSSYNDYRMAGRIQRGDIALDLVRPADFQRSRFAETMGVVCFEVVVGVIVVTLGALAFGGLTLPPSPASAALATVSLVLVVPLRFGLVYISGLATFWTQNYVGVQAARIALVTLFSGTMVPFAFLPGWLATTCTLLPFAGMAATPALVFSGAVQGARAVEAVAVQLAWAVGMWWGARLCWQAASRRLTVHGG